MIATIRNRGLFGFVSMARKLAVYHVLRALGQRYVTVRLQGFRMVLDLHDPGISRELFVLRQRERILYAALSELLREGMNVLDVGGNLGYYPLIEHLRVRQGGKVYVLEPFPPNFELLERNISLNGAEGHIIPFRKAAFLKSGRVKFYVSRESNLGTLFTRRSDTGTAHYLTGESLWVEAVNLSDLLAELPRVDLIRMDPEGAEVACIQSLLPAIRSGHFSGMIVTELHPSAYDAANDMRAVLKELFALNYLPRGVTSLNEPSPLLTARGYQPRLVIRESNTTQRGLYERVSPVHVLELINDTTAFRDLILSQSPAV